jgi:Protein of unknown function (DUF1161)
MAQLHSPLLSKLFIIATLSCTASLALAQTPASEEAKPADTGSKAVTCDSLKQTITDKLEAKGVKNYQLDIVDTADVPASSKVIGSCDGGKHKIVYVRESGNKT